MKKTAMQLNSNNCSSAFKHSTSGWHEADVIYTYHPFDHTEYSKDVYLGFSFNKINGFYCFIEDILKWNWLFFLLTASLY